MSRKCLLLTTSLLLLTIALLPLCECQIEAEEKLSTAANCFTLNFYKQLAKKDGNLVTSPFSLDVLLSMLRVGAGGKTYQELTTPLGYDGLSVSDMQGAFKSKLSKLTSKNDNTLEVANSIWLQEQFKIVQSFKDAAVNNFYAQIENVDFAGNPKDSTAKINSWGSDKTHGLIPKLFGNDLDQSTVMVLINAIYFKGEWVHKFEKEATVDGDFYKNEVKQNPSKVKLMNQVNSFKYGFDNTLNSQILELDYTGGDMSMVIILPGVGSTVKNLEATLTCDNFKTALGAKWESLVSVTLPKFKIESTFDLIQPIMDVGIEDIFESGANFSGIAENIAVSKAIQKAIIKVYEEGSEAAVLTGIGIVKTTAVRPQPKIEEFRADHPFLYMIVDKTTNVILFMGRVSDPRDAP